MRAHHAAAIVCLALAGVLTWVAWTYEIRWVYIPANVFTLGALLALFGNEPADAEKDDRETGSGPR